MLKYSYTESNQPQRIKIRATPTFLVCLSPQNLRVKWNNMYSDYFSVTNGVKQGGIISPLLFCIYILMYCLTD